MTGRAIQIIFYNDPDGYPPIINGVRLLAQAGWHVELLCRGGGTRWNVSYPDGVQVIRIASEGRPSLREYAAFVMCVVRHGSRKSSLIYAHDMHALVPARILATVHRLPLVFHSHDFADNPQSLTLGSRVVHSFQKRFARTADEVVIPDVDRASVIARELKLKREPMIVANAPLNRPQSAGTALPRAIAAQGRNLERVVFRQGRIGPGHAIEATLRSLPLWSSPNWGFVIMGISEPSYLEKLKGMARALGVERQFLALPPVGYDQVAEFTPGSDVGHALYEPVHVNNVHITTASNKIMEYMEAGVPLLVSDTPSLRELVEKYKCGLVADEKSPESIAASINRLLGDPEQSKGMGGAARLAFEKVFCYERQFATVINSFRALA